MEENDVKATITFAIGTDTRPLLSLCSLRRKASVWRNTKNKERESRNTPPHVSILLRPTYVSTYLFLPIEKFDQRFASFQFEVVHQLLLILRGTSIDGESWRVRLVVFNVQHHRNVLDQDVWMQCQINVMLKHERNVSKCSLIFLKLAHIFNILYSTNQSGLVLYFAFFTFLKSPPKAMIYNIHVLRQVYNGQMRRNERDITNFIEIWHSANSANSTLCVNANSMRS